jgi:hypothetical protein
MTRLAAAAAERDRLTRELRQVSRDLRHPARPVQPATPKPEPEPE